MPTTLQLFEVINCSDHGLWRELIEKRLDATKYEYDIPGTRLRAWDSETTLHKTPVKGISYRDGIELTRVFMPNCSTNTLVGINFCRLYFKEGSKYPACESHAELFPEGKAPPILKHLPLIPGLQPFIDTLNTETPLIAHLPDLNYTNLASSVQFKFAHATTNADTLSSGSFSSNVLSYIRNRRASTPVDLDLALIIPFTRFPDGAKKVAGATSEVLEKEWGCNLTKTLIQTREELEQWLQSNETDKQCGFFALDTKIGERPSADAIQWMKALEDKGIAYSLLNSSSKPNYTRHGNAMHILNKLGGCHYTTYPSSVTTLPDHWCIGLDLGFGGQYQGKVAVISLTDGTGKLTAYWRAIKDKDETLSLDILEEGLSWIIEKAEELRPGQNYIALRDGRCPHNESIEFYKELLPSGRSTFVEYVKKGNPMMNNGNQQPAPATLCFHPGNEDGFIFTATAPQRDSLTNTVKFFSRHNELNYTREQLAEIIASLCFAPKLSFQPSSLPAPIYWADGIASLSHANLQFAGWSHLPNKTRDFRDI